MVPSPKNKKKTLNNRTSKARADPSGPPLPGPRRLARWPRRPSSVAAACCNAPYPQPVRYGSPEAAVSTSLLLQWLSYQRMRRERYPLFLIIILILTQARRLSISPRPHGLIVALLPKRTHSCSVEGWKGEDYLLLLLLLLLSPPCPSASPDGRLFVFSLRVDCCIMRPNRPFLHLPLVINHGP